MGTGKTVHVEPIVVGSGHAKAQTLVVFLGLSGPNRPAPGECILENPGLFA
jgi:hypothetical protein